MTEESRAILEIYFWFSFLKIEGEILLGRENVRLGVVMVVKAVENKDGPPIPPPILIPPDTSPIWIAGDLGLCD